MKPLEDALLIATHIIHHNHSYDYSNDVATTTAVFINHDYEDNHSNEAVVQFIHCATQV